MQPALLPEVHGQSVGATSSRQRPHVDQPASQPEHWIVGAAVGATVGARLGSAGAPGQQMSPSYPTRFSKQLRWQNLLLSQPCVVSGVLHRLLYCHVAPEQLVPSSTMNCVG